MITVKIERPDGWTTIDATPIASTARWSSSSPGGFSSASVALDGFRPADIPYLSRLTILFGDQVAWEGLVEDVRMMKIDTQGKWAISLTAFGQQRELDRVAMNRWYSRRDQQWEIEWPVQEGVAITAIGGAPSHTVALTNNLNVIAGQVDKTDTSKYGIRFEGQGKSVPGYGGLEAWSFVGNTSAQSRRYPDLRFNTGIARVMGNYTMVGTAWASGGLRFDLCFAQASPAAVPFGAGIAYPALSLFASGASTFDVAIPSGFATQTDGTKRANMMYAVISNYGSAGVTLPSTHYVQLTNVRTLHTSVLESTASGPRFGYSGFYGGDLVRDIISLVPDLKVGQIAPGDDYALDQFPNPAGPTPKYARQLIEEIAGYYDKVWAVWEGGRFDWKDVDTDTPEWTLRLDECLEGSEIAGTVGGLYASVYVTGQYANFSPDFFTFAYDVDQPQSGVSNIDRQLNPFVKTNKIADLILSTQFPMGPAIADQLAFALAAYANAYVPITGSLIVTADKAIVSGQGRRTAALIRAGDQIVIPDLPVQDLMRSASRQTGSGGLKSSLNADAGQTSFTITESVCDLNENRVTLKVDNHGAYADVLLARLAGVSRRIARSL